MLFNSLAFLYAFLPVTCLVFWRLRSKGHRYLWLTLTGYVFYSFWNYKFCALMAFSTVISYLAGLGFLRWQSPRARRLCLILPVSLDLTLLATFKYWDFAAQTLNGFNFPLTVPYLALVLPVGISFYTFHTITYVVDGYRGVIVPTRNFCEFACYVSFFPQLIAGPIVRFRQVEGDLEHIDRRGLPDALERGMSFFAIGMIKKVLIADSIAAIINPMLGQWHTLSTPAAWVCALGYTYQLYFDFSGYSDMAVGLALFFGIRLPQNFNSPYKAIDLSDFWRRWHISLSTVLRDYLYIPLGGGKRGELLSYRNLMFTMLLGGLWHGANWTFVVWGGYHGLLLAGTKVIGSERISAIPVEVRKGVTFLLVAIGWVLFRSGSFEMAWFWLQRMFLWHNGANLTEVGVLIALIAVAAYLAHCCPNTFELSHNWGMAPTFGLALLFLTSLIVIVGGKPSPFLYFQF
jgi:alginate O-acetyltransferase complex protein AlgI